MKFLKNRPLRIDRLATYKFMDVKDFDYDLIKDNFEELLKVTINNNITQIKTDSISKDLVQ